MDRSDKLDYTTEYEDPELDALIEQRCAEEQGLAGSVTGGALGPRLTYLQRVFDGIGEGRRSYGCIDPTLIVTDPLACLGKIAVLALLAAAYFGFQQLLAYLAELWFY